MVIWPYVGSNYGLICSRNHAYKTLDYHKYCLRYKIDCQLLLPSKMLLSACWKLLTTQNMPVYTDMNIPFLSIRAFFCYEKCSLHKPTPVLGRQWILKNHSRPRTRVDFYFSGSGVVINHSRRNCQILSNCATLKSCFSY